MIRPLEGITILDLSRVLSGPFATQQLVDLGARILKIEHPKEGDDTRRFGPPFIAGESTYFMSVNRGKESVAIDLKHPRGRALVLGLARHADVALENFRPGTAERLGLGPDALRAVQPKLVTCSISGFGADGHPDYAGLPGYDAVIQAVSGLMAITGEPTAEPTRVGVAMADMVAGLFAAQGILAALVERGRTGVGRHVEISMQDALTTMLTYQAGIYFGTGKSPKRLGNAHPSICPYETVQAKDGIYTIAIGNDGQFLKLCARVGLDSLAEDPKFATNRARVENRPELMAILAPKFAERTGAEWDRIFSEEGIPGGPVLEVSQALEHPQLLARGSVLIHQHPLVGTLRTLATPVRIDHERPAEIAPPPTLGQHTDPILRELLGLDDRTLAELRAEGAIGGPPSPEV